MKTLDTVIAGKIECLQGEINSLERLRQFGEIVPIIIATFDFANSFYINSRRIAIRCYCDDLRDSSKKIAAFIAKNTGEVLKFNHETSDDGKGTVWYGSNSFLVHFDLIGDTCQFVKVGEKSTPIYELQCGGEKLNGL